MAGAGFKTFTAGSILTASDTNTYLMQQSTMVFATTTARDAAITAPSDGMMCYVNSGDANEGLYSYNGSAWRKGAGWNAPWGVVMNKAQTTSFTTTSTSGATITNFTQSVPLVNNRTYRMSLSVNLSNSTASAFNAFYIRVGGTSIQSSQMVCGNTSNVFSHAFTTYYTATSTATATVDVLASVNAGTMTIGASAGFGSTFIVEDMGPSGAPA